MAPAEGASCGESIREKTKGVLGRTSGGLCGRHGVAALCGPLGRGSRENRAAEVERRLGQPITLCLRLGALQAPLDPNRPRPRRVSVSETVVDPERNQETKCGRLRRH